MPAARNERLLFFFVVALHLVPIWAFTYFPSQDGPAHLASAVALRSLLTGENGIFQQYFVLNPMLSANWLSHLLLTGLLTFLPAVVAEKILLSLCVAGLPYAARLTLAAMRPEAAWMAVLTLPFIYSFTFHMGFYSFSLGLPVLFLYLALHLRWRKHITVWRLVTLFLLGSVLYLAHMLTFDIAVMVVGCLEAWSALLFWRGHHVTSAPAGDRWFQIGRRLLPLLPFFPGAVIQFSFALSLRSRAWVQPGREMTWRWLTGHAPLVSFLAEERWLGLLVYLLFLGLVLFTAVVRWRQRSTSEYDGLLLAALAFLLLSFVAPNSAFGGGQITVRLLLAMFFCFALWIGTHLKLRAVAYAGCVAATVLSLAAISFRLPVYARIDRQMKEYTSAAAHMEMGSTLLALNLAGRGRDASGQPLSIHVRPFKHADGYLAADRRGVMLRNYESHAGHFPLLFRTEVDPWKHLGSFEDRPLSFAYETYVATTPARIDYFLLSPGELLSASTRTREFQQVLAANYDLVYISEPRGLVHLYHRRPD